MMTFVPRLTRPKAGNKYYIRKANGGYSNAVLGNPTDKECNVLSNCVGYAYGRFNEIGGYKACKYLAPVNAEQFMSFKGTCEVGQTPKLGACMVWQKGATLSGSDGAGHVAIVEKVISDTEVVTSESGWGDKRVFWTQTRKKGSNGRWGCGSSYKFLGFIYNPAVKDEPKVEVTPIVSKDIDKNQIQVIVANLNVRTGAGTNYARIGYAKKGYYNYSETKKANGYTWYKIAANQWIASSSNWTIVYEAIDRSKIKVDSARKRSTSFSGKYKVSAPHGTYLRSGASTSKTDLGFLQKGTVVRNYGYYNVGKDNSTWLYVKTDAGVVGYCLITHLQKS